MGYVLWKINIVFKSNQLVGPYFAAKLSKNGFQFVATEGWYSEKQLHVTATLVTDDI